MKASNRVRIGHAIVAGFAFLAITLGNSAAVRADALVATTGSSASADYTYTGSATGASLSGGSGNNATTTTSVTFGSTFFTPSGPYLATVSLSASTTSAASSVGGQAGTQSGWNGSFTITNESGSTVGGVANGSVFVTVNFTDALLTLTGANSNGTLASQTAGTTTITPASGFGAPITQPESFSITLSGTSFTGSTAGSNFENFTANDASTSSATLAVPEPSTLAIAGLGALGLIGYGIRRRRKGA